MKQKNEKHTVWILLLLALAVLFPVSTPARTVQASAIPASGTLTIHDGAGDQNETNGISAQEAPFTGAEYTLWQVEPSVAANVASASQARQNIWPATKQTGNTGGDGTLTFSLDNGLYYVIETNGGETAVSEPFLVSVPMADPSGSGWIKNVHVYAKKQPSPQSVVIDKFVGEAGNTDYPFNDYDASKYKPVAANTAFGWSILSSLPSNLGTAAKETYSVTDTLKGCFDYVSGSVTVYSVSAKNTPVTSAYRLTEGTDYTQKFDTGTKQLVMELTASGITRLGNRYTSNQDRYLLIKYDCRLNSTAAQGVRHHSGASVEYTRNAVSSPSAYHSSGTKAAAVNLSTNHMTAHEATALSTVGTKSVETGQVAASPAVHTGQIGITKLEDDTNKPLKNAEFGLAATESDAKTGIFLATGKTDSNGELSFSGLLYGAPGDSPTENTGDTTYWLVETKAPTGYQLVKDPVEVTFYYQQDGDTGACYFAELDVYNVPDSKAGGAQENTGDVVDSNEIPEKKMSPIKRIVSAIRTGDTKVLYPVMAVMLLSLVVIAVLTVSISRNKKKVSK